MNVHGTRFGLYIVPLSMYLPRILSGFNIPISRAHTDALHNTCRVAER